jgi:hypothetical protein
MIRAEYDGCYPNACSGTLCIYRDNVLIYETEPYSFHSTGSVWFDNEWSEHVECGELCWNDESKEKFDKWLETQEHKSEIKESVEDALSGANVCCGGCI